MSSAAKPRTKNPATAPAAHSEAAASRGTVAAECGSGESERRGE
jgi:hypothetical protein